MNKNSRDIKITLNKIFKKEFEYTNSVDEFPSEFYNIELFKSIDGNSANIYCKHCSNNDYPIRLFNHCLKHIYLLNLKDLYNDAVTQMDTLNNNEKDLLRLSLIKIIIKLKLNINGYKKINRDNFDLLNLKFTDNNHNGKFIVNNCLSYDALTKEYAVDKYIETDNNYTFDEKNIKCINTHSINLLKFRQMLYEYRVIKSFFIRNKLYKIHIDNAEIIYTKILECNSLKNGIISNIQLEREFFIDDTVYRSDICLDIKLLNKDDSFIRTVIEVDENHHYNDDDAINNDRIKDIYWVRNKYAIIRVDIYNRKVNDDDINDVIRHLIQIHLSAKPLYIFSKRYIKSHEVVNKFAKGIHITREEFLSVQ
jgi:hypothetical protein